MKFFSLFVIISMLSSSLHAIVLKKYEKSPRNFYSVGSIASKIASNDLEMELRNFVKETRPSRYVGTKGHSAVIPYLIDKIKKIDPEVSAIMMTGYRMEMDELVHEALSKTAYTCIYKPFDMPKILSLIEELM